MVEKGGRMDRREFLRRSAIVGGTVAWMTPVIQSLTPPAYAHVTPNSGTTCCRCQTGATKVCGLDVSSTDCTNATGGFCEGFTSAQFNSGHPHGYVCNNNNCTQVVQGHP